MSSTCHAPCLSAQFPLCYSFTNVTHARAQNPSFVGNYLGKNIGIISRISYKLPTHILINLYYSLVYPYIAYCNMVWASNYKSRLVRLIILQKRAIRLIARSCYRCHTKELFSSHHILTIEQIRVLQTGVFMFCYKC